MTITAKIRWGIGFFLVLFALFITHGAAMLIRIGAWFMDREDVVTGWDPKEEA